VAILDAALDAGGEVSPLCSLSSLPNHHRDRGPQCFIFNLLMLLNRLGLSNLRNEWKHSKALPPGVWIKGRGYVVHNDHGGLFHEYNARWSEIAAMDDQVEVLGYCASGCTVLTMHIPKERLCFGEDASLNFHMAGHLPEKPNFEFTKWMISKYPDDIRAWITKRGRIGDVELLPPIYGFWTLTAHELWKMGYQKCTSAAEAKRKEEEEEERERWRKRDEKAAETWRKYQEVIQTWR
jgi:hypothetical protein